MKVIHLTVSGKPVLSVLKFTKDENPPFREWFGDDINWNPDTGCGQYKTLAGWFCCRGSVGSYDIEHYLELLLLSRESFILFSLGKYKYYITNYMRFYSSTKAVYQLMEDVTHQECFIDDGYEVLLGSRTLNTKLEEALRIKFPVFKPVQLKIFPKGFINALPKV